MWCIQKALYEWRCATGVNMVILKDTFGLPKVSTPDIINHIFLSSTIFQAATTRTRFDFCAFTMQPLVDIDFAINDAPSSPFHYDTLGNLPPNKIDFYKVVLHEIGHALLLNHVTDTLAIMYPFQTTSVSNSIPYSQRNLLIMNDKSAYKAGRHAVNIQLDTDALACGFLPMNILPICQNYTSIGNQIRKENLLLAYPNPFSDYLNIIPPNSELISEVNLIGVDGRLIKNIKNTNLSNQIFTLPELNSSNYIILQVKTSKNIYTKKLFHE
jgi:hypothetical protein